MAEDECTAIVVYEVRAEDRDLFLNAWKRANDYLKKQPGLVSTTLHQAASANPRFRFANIARWESADHFRGATQSSGFQEASGQLAAYPVYASVYEVVTT